MSDTALQWLYVDFNSYFASVEQQLQPHLRGRPIAVVPVATDSTCAIAASYEAKAFGVKTGTPIYEARKLCPDIICVLAQHNRYVDFHHQILDEINRHIPVTAVCSIDEAACRLMKNEASPAAATAIAHAMKRGLAQNVGAYVRCSIGIASNRYLAKVATDLQKPDGFTILHPQDLPDALFRLDLRDLPGIGRNMERRLHQAGIHDMPMLMALSSDRMRDIWGGIWGERMWHLLRGVDLPEIETQRRTLGHSHVMAPDLRAPSKAIYVARRLTLKAASRLRRMGYFASAFSFAARCEDGRRVEGSLKCWRAKDSPTFLRLLDTIWNQVIPTGSSIKVKKISVTLHGLIHADNIQPDLFDQHMTETSEHIMKGERLSHAMDRLNHRFGRDAVLLGMLPSQGASFSGTKIAFTRIPDREEFLE